jgi:FAD/FMN-containing dehydrogenase
MTNLSAELISRFIAIVGAQGAITNPEDQLLYLKEWRDLWVGKTPVVLRPSTTEQVSAIMALAYETNTKIVPQSGNTGLVGGQIPNSDGSEILLSLDRMNRMRDVDVLNNTITAEAGVTIKALQDKAAELDQLYPLSLASEGSARVGGTLSTNAGGLNVLAYGSAREHCIGLEIVLADGRILNGLSKLRKDNTGYDLRNIFIGAEGTLGIITAAVLKLVPKPRRVDTAFIAVPTPQAAVELLSLFKQKVSNSMVAFEIMSEIGVHIACKHLAAKRPLADVSPWYVLTELADAPENALEETLEQALENELVTDAVIAQSQTQRDDIWAVRERMSDAQKHEGGSIKHDISVPISSIPKFIEEGTQALHQLMPEARLVAFGHLGDGNLHFNVLQPVAMDKQVYLSHWKEMASIIHALVISYNGSISAEHGIGQLKREDMRLIKSDVQLDIMRGLKNLFDPKGILNPGKVVPR